MRKTLGRDPMTWPVGVVLVDNPFFDGTDEFSSPVVATTSPHFLNSNPGDTVVWTITDGSVTNTSYNFTNLRFRFENFRPVKGKLLFNPANKTITGTLKDATKLQLMRYGYAIMHGEAVVQDPELDVSGASGILTKRKARHRAARRQRRHAKQSRR